MFLDELIGIFALHQAQRQSVLGRVAFDDHGTHQCHRDPALPFVHADLLKLATHTATTYIEKSEIGTLTRVPLRPAKPVHVLEEAEYTLQDAVWCSVVLDLRLEELLAFHGEFCWLGDIVCFPSMHSPQNLLLRGNRRRHCHNRNINKSGRYNLPFGDT